MIKVPEDSLAGWSNDQPIDFEVGKTYVVTATHVKGFWASMLIAIVDCNSEGIYEFELETVLDGSPGIVDGFDLAPDNN